MSCRKLTQTSIESSEKSSELRQNGFQVVLSDSFSWCLMLFFSWLFNGLFILVYLGLLVVSIFLHLFFGLSLGTSPCKKGFPAGKSSDSRWLQGTEGLELPKAKQKTKHFSKKSPANAAKKSNETTNRSFKTTG